MNYTSFSFSFLGLLRPARELPSAPFPYSLPHSELQLFSFVVLCPLFPPPCSGWVPCFLFYLLDLDLYIVILILYQVCIPLFPHPFFSFVLSLPLLYNAPLLPFLLGIMYCVLLLVVAFRALLLFKRNYNNDPQLKGL